VGQIVAWDICPVIAVTILPFLAYDLPVEFRRRATICIPWWIRLIVATACLLPANAERVLESILEIRDLSLAEAKKKIRVEVRVQIVKVQFNSRSGGLYVCDGDAGIYVHPIKKKKLLDMRTGLKVGDHVLLKGYTTPGYFRPDIKMTDFEVLKNGTLPQPRKVTFAEFIDPDFDCRWVEFDAVLMNFRPSHRVGQVVAEVRSADVPSDVQFPTGEHINMRHVELNTLFNVVVPGNPDSMEQLNRLKYHDVSIRAMAVTHFTNNRKFIDRYFQCPSIEFVLLKDPPQVELTTIRNIFDCGTNPLQLSRVQGTLLHQTGGTLYLRGNRGCLVVHSLDKTQFQRGEKLEVHGRVKTSLQGPSLYINRVQRLEKKVENPQPVELERVEGRIHSRFHGELVSLPEVFLKSTTRTKSNVVLECRVSGFDFRADIPLECYKKLKLREGCLMQLSGICRLVGGELGISNELQAGNFLIHLRDADDVLVVQVASWWTLEKSLYVLSVLVVLVFGISIWSLTLRRKVVEQTELIGAKIESAAVLEERQRMAREFHDTFQQNMTGVAIQLSTLREELPSKDEDSHSTLGIARKMLEHCRTEAYEAITELRSTDGSVGSLGDLLDEKLLSQFVSIGAKINVETDGVVCPLSARVTHHLLRVTSEALTNALRHASPRHVEVRFQYFPEEIKICVQDDGVGFDLGGAVPAGHFGLVGMQERAERVGAVISIESEPGAGTKILLALDRKKLV